MDMFYRRATVEDRQDVVSILSAYGGRDYMVTTYHKMISDPEFVGVVAQTAKDGGETVAFAGAYVINGGTTMSTKGSRVREDLQGQGIYGKLWNFLRDTIRQLSPRLKYEEFSINSINPLHKVPEPKRKYKELYRTPWKYYNLPRSINQSMGMNSRATGIVDVDGDMIQRILVEEKRASILFPRRLVISWRVYQPIMENVDIVKRGLQYATGSVKGDNNDDLGFIVFGSWFQCADFLAYTIDCYGKANDMTDISEHFRKHAKMAFHVYPGKVTFLIFADSDLIDSVNKACLSLGFEPETFFSTHQAVMVREV